MARARAACAHVLDAVAEDLHRRRVDRGRGGGDGDLRRGGGGEQRAHHHHPWLKRTKFNPVHVVRHGTLGTDARGFCIHKINQAPWYIKQRVKL